MMEIQVMRVRHEPSVGYGIFKLSHQNYVDNSARKTLNCPYFPKEGVYQVICVICLIVELHSEYDFKSHTDSLMLSIYVD